MALFEATEDVRYERAMREELVRSAQLDEQRAVGLFEGLAGLRAVAALACSTSDAYVTLVEQCDSYIEGALNEEPSPTTASNYDLISGWAGILLSRAVTRPVAWPMLEKKISWLCSRDEHWRFPHPMRLDEPPINDLGLAHGIPGILAAVALGLEYSSDLHHLLSQAAVRVFKYMRPNGDWPLAIQSDIVSPTRSVWCYGAAGVANALYLMGRWLHDTEIESRALGALLNVANRSAADWRIDGQAICHGSAGIALILSSVATHSGSSVLADAAQRVTHDLLDAFENDGERCISHLPDGSRYDFIDDLNGVVGIALTLLTLEGSSRSTWLRLHGLAAFP